MSDAQLATFATSYVTAEGMLRRASVAEGNTVLISGASGGVRSALVQLVLRRGAVAIAMCSESKARQVNEIGAAAVLPRATSNLPAALKSAIGQPDVDVVVDVAEDQTGHNSSSRSAEAAAVPARGLSPAQSSSLIFGRSILTT